MHWLRAKPHPLFSWTLSSDSSDSNYFTTSWAWAPFRLFHALRTTFNVHVSLHAFMNLIMFTDLVKHFSLTKLCLFWRRSQAAASFACITMHVLHTEPKQNSLGCESSLVQSGSRSSSADFFTVPSELARSLKISRPPHSCHWTVAMPPKPLWLCKNVYAKTVRIQNIRTHIRIYDMTYDAFATL